jgi:hypothetical protein
VRANHFGRCECSMKPMFARVASAGQRAARQDRGPGIRSVNIITSRHCGVFHHPRPPPWWKHLTAATESTYYVPSRRHTIIPRARAHLGRRFR